MLTMWGGSFIATVTGGPFLYVWGQAGGGQLGLGNGTNRSSPVQLGTSINWSNIAGNIAGGTSHTIATKTDGTLWLWGSGNYGQLGNNTNVAVLSPIQVGALTTWSKVNAGDYNSTAIKTDGTLWTWGNNNQGQLGDGTAIAKSSPIQVGALTTWSQIANNRHTIALKTDGTLWAFGYNTSGQLGDNTNVPRSSPVQIGSLTTWSQISVHLRGTMAIKTDGTLWLWGNSNYGRMGDNTTIAKSSPTQVGALTNWSKIAAGQEHSVAVKTDGSLWIWGRNNNGQLGDNTIADKSSPVQVGAVIYGWSQIGAASHSMVIRSDGTLWAMGNNGNGGLGDNTVINRSSPVQVGSLTTWSSLFTSSGGGGNNTSLALKTDGTMWAWGQNTFGHVGDNTLIDRSSPVQIGALTTWSKTASGGAHSMAIKTNGTLWTWGENAMGKLGDNTSSINRSSPVQIGALTTWSQIAGGSTHSMALKTDGTIWTWGRNSFGQLGDSTGYVNKSSPVQVGSLTTWSQINTGGLHNIAIKTDGTLWTWGQNTKGQLGDNTVIHRSSPVQVGALTTWSKIAGGEGHSLAIKTDGTLWSFGYNQMGQLGDSSVVYKRSSPVQVGSLTTWSKISGGQNHTVAAKTDSTLWTWGRNEAGQLGDNTINSRNSPGQVGLTPGATWSKIASADHTIALKTDGTMWLWGRNSNYGSLGDNTIIDRSSPVQIGASTSWTLIATGNYHNMAIG